MSIPKIFISSTCYDLVDLRAELEHEFRSLGLEVMLSDSYSSDFIVDGRANAIESCLQNVRSSDYYLLILSQKYGTILESGYGHISATHLEFNEAVKHDKPIFVYVRDKFEAEYNLFRKSGRQVDMLRFIEKKNSVELFQFYEEIKDLDAIKARSNWIYFFGTSVQLKETLRNQFSKLAARTRMEKLIEQGNVPLITLDGARVSRLPNSDQVHFIIAFKNFGNSTALNPRFVPVSWQDPSGQKTVFNELPVSHNTMGPTEIREFHFTLSMGKDIARDNWTILEGEMEYDSEFSMTLSDKLLIKIFWTEHQVTSDICIAQFVQKFIVDELQNQRNIQTREALKKSTGYYITV